jgi:hypothetical protein
MSLEHFQSPRFQQAIDQVYAVRPLLNAARIARGPVRMGSVTADNACVVAITLVFDLEREIKYSLVRSEAVREADPEGYREHLDNLRKQQLPDPRFVLKHLHVAGDELRRQEALDLSALKAEIQLECDAAAVLMGQKNIDHPDQIPQTHYVDLSQAAAMVHLKPKGLANYKRRKDEPLPDPDVTGGGGRKDLWLWTTMRPWLVRNFPAIQIPECCPEITFLRGRI